MAGKSPVSDRQWLEIHRRALAGESFAALEREVGYAPGSVRKVLRRRFGYSLGAASPAMTREVSDAIHARVQAGENLNAIARELKVNSANLRKLMANRYGYSPQPVKFRHIWAPTVDLGWAEDTDLAYLAGLMDGEGSIMHMVRGRGHPIWVVKIAMTDRPVIEWLHKFGGSFTVEPVSQRYKNHLDMYRWWMTRRSDVRAILQAMLPYLQVKRDKAVEALDDLATYTDDHCDWTEEEMANGGLFQGAGTHRLYPAS
jgi:hypothetical protein